MSQPMRLRLSRQKGFNLKNASLTLNGLDVVNVARPSKYGNPWPVNHEGTEMHCLSIGLDGSDETDRATAAVDLFCRWVEKHDGGKVNELVASFLTRPQKSPPLLRHIQRDLAGKNLACWCALDKPCHADVLLRLANQ